MIEDGNLLERMDAALLGHERRVADLARRLTALERGGASDSTLVGVDHQAGPPHLDPHRYLIFFDTLRGSEDDVTAAFGTAARWLAETPPVLDLGCGRGELLRLLENEHQPALGIDSNPAMIERARSKGSVRCDDVFAALARRDGQTAGGVAMVRLLEHLPAADAGWLLQSAARVVRPGGRLYVESVDAASSGNAFWRDPTRVRPYPAETLELLIDNAGFDLVDTRSLGGPGEPALAVRAVRR